jgi:iron complex transport system permease protein
VTAVARATVDVDGRERLPRTRRRRTFVVLALTVLLACSCVLSIAIGTKAMPPSAVWHALVDPTGGANDIVVRSLRLPRTVLGVLAGVALGLAGALMQGHTRNPLAEPGILGVNAGAAFAVVLAVYGLGVSSLLGYVWFAFAGALAASVVVFLLGVTGAGGRGEPTPIALALAGIAVTFLLLALTNAVVLLDQQTLEAYRFWSVGALSGRDPAIIGQVVWFVAAGTMLALVSAPGLNALSLGEDVARALGQPVWLTRLLGAAAITLLAGAAGRGLRADHLPRPGGTASGPRADRSGLPLAAALLGVAGCDRPLGRRRGRPGGRRSRRTRRRHRAGLHRGAVLRRPGAQAQAGGPVIATPQRVRVPGRVPLRIGPVSGVWRPRPMLVALAGLVVLVLAGALNIGRGDYSLGVGEVLKALTGAGDPAARFIVLELRAPRSLTGALVGAALAVAGAITQAVARNPLASPDFLGITTGSAAAAVAVIVLGGTYGAISGPLAEVGVPMAALVGGLITAGVIYLLAWRDGIQGYRFVLIGIGVHAVLLATIYWLLVFGDVTDTARALVWLNGSLGGRGWEHVVPVGLAMLVLLPAALLLAFVLGALQLSDDTARGLGIRVDLARGALLLVAVVLAAVAVAGAGPIAFVGLVTPQIAMRLARTARPPLLTSAILGAALVVVADLLARTAFGTTGLPVGIVTAVLGAPYLLFLIARRRREAIT